jgi:hypothetical protein
MYDAPKPTQASHTTSQTPSDVMSYPVEADRTPKKSPNRAPAARLKRSRAPQKPETQNQERDIIFLFSCHSGENPSFAGVALSQALRKGCFRACPIAVAKPPKSEQSKAFAMPAELFLPSQSCDPAKASHASP